MGVPGHQPYRLCLCRNGLLRLLLCHVALRATRRSATGAPLGAKGAMMDKRPDDHETPRAETAVEIIALNKWFGEFHVLREIDLKVARGERIVICGPSGSGKSTLLRCINHLEDW